MFGTKKPTVNHLPCGEKDCNNYFNTRYKYANGYCRLCNKKKKSEEKTSFGDNIYKSWNQSLVDGFMLHGAEKKDDNR